MSRSAMDRREGLMKACRCGKSYESLEVLVKDARIEAVFVATDAPSHARHSIEALQHGKHVMSAVPATFGSIEDGEKLLETVNKTHLKYMMAETSCYREDCFAMRRIYQAGGFGWLVYSEGEYFHHVPTPLPSFKGWRIGCPPLPPGVPAGGHGGSHGPLMNEFITAILEDRQPLVNVYEALAMTVPGIVAHQSALKDGETLKVPQYLPPPS